MATDAAHPDRAWRIRAAAPADAAELGRLHVQCWQETYRGIVPQALLARFSLERSRTVWGRILGDPDAYHATRVFLAEQAGVLVGFGACGAQRTAELAAKAYDGEISAIYLVRAAHRQGIGRALLDALAADLLERDFKALGLWVLRENAAARRFYEHLGGAAVDEKRDIREQTVLHETAYGWPSLTDLRKRLRPARDA